MTNLTIKLLTIVSNTAIQQRPHDMFRS